MKQETIKSYGLKSKSLAFFLAEFMAIETSQVFIISPFISQFPIPPIDLEFKLGQEQFTSFFGAISMLQKRGIKIEIFTTDGYVSRIIDAIGKESKNISIKIINKLHEKFFITSNYFYKGSANLTYSGLNANLENCEIGLVGENKEYLKRIIHEVNSASRPYKFGKV